MNEDRYPAFPAYKKGALFAALDLETTGLEPESDRIVEIGALKFDRTGVIARYSTLIDPGIPMPKEAEKVNKISDEMLKGKPKLEEVFPDFLRFIEGAFLAVHNAPFDLGFIRRHAPNLPNPVVDTLPLSRELFPGFRSYSLQNLASALGISAQCAHRAEDDARLCMEILLRCINSLDKH